MRQELTPAGVVETMLVERVVSLSWRLQRVEHLQNEAFDALLAEEATPLAKLERSMMPGGSQDEGELALGWAVVKDFSGSRVLDRLLMYERRIEHSLFVTLHDLRKLRVLGQGSRQKDEMGTERAGSGPVRASLGGARVPARLGGLVRGPLLSQGEPAPALSGARPTRLSLRAGAAKKRLTASL